MGINGNKAEKNGSDPAGEQDRKSSEGGGERERGKEYGAMKAVDTDSKGEKRQQAYCNSTLALQFLAQADCDPPDDSEQVDHTTFTAGLGSVVSSFHQRDGSE